MGHSKHSRVRGKRGLEAATQGQGTQPLTTPTITFYLPLLIFIAGELCFAATRVDRAHETLPREGWRGGVWS